ncbi:hypothetical protein [Pseudomonas sp. NUPR-001]|uniref:hypothetical protein n=1 Tax=Pseudomonas sp. NUPR-001 TaxID=3416058 RepID=UPI003F9A7E8D
MKLIARFLQTFSGTLGGAIALWAFELWGGDPKRVPSLLLLLIAGVLALTACLKYVDEDFKKTFLSVGTLPSIAIFLISAISIRQGWLGFEIDLEQTGLIGKWALAMIGAQTVFIIIYKSVFKTKTK